MDRGDRRYNWVTCVTVLSLGWLVLYATRTALSSALKDIGDYWGLSESYLGILSSSFFMSYMFLQIPSGLLADRFGSRKVLLLGFGIQAVGLFLGALSSSPVQFMLSRVFTGAGQATYFACQQAIVSFTVPMERRSLGTAITTCGAGVGSATGFLLGKFLSAGGFGWKMPFLALGVVSAAFIFVVIAAVPDARAGKPDTKSAKYGAGTSEHDAVAGEAGSPVSSAKEGFPQAASATGQALAPAVGQAMVSPPRPNWVFLGLASASHFLSMYGFYMMLSWMPYYLEVARGMQGGLAAVIPIVMPLIMAPATVIGGIIADKKGSKTFVLTYTMPVAAVATALIPSMKSPAMLALALSLYGATGKLVIDPGLVSIVSENSPKETRGATLAFFNFWAAFAMTVAPAVTGLIAQVTGSFDVSFYAAGAFNLMALGAILAAVKVARRVSLSSRSLSR